jgi:TM2 domain-containing membrane protein YozV
MSPPGAFGPTTAGGRSRVAAAIFAIFLGGVGIHKFYLGRIWQGVLYLLFCWTFVPAIVGFIEGIVYLTMSDASFEAKYG